MANGDITNADVIQFVEFGTVTDAHKTQMDEVCNGINADVNLILKNLGVSLPVTDSDSIQWLKQTKLFGSASLIIDMLMGQDTEEENTRAQRYWDKYQARLSELIESGGTNLEAEFREDPRPVQVPLAIGKYGSRADKLHLRFPQRAAAEKYEDEAATRKSRASWRSRIGGW